MKLQRMSRDFLGRSAGYEGIPGNMTRMKIDLE